MKKYIYLILIGFSSSFSFSQADNIIGTWLTEDKEAHIEISKQNNAYVGKIVWLKKPIDPQTGKPWLDKENDDKAKQKLPLMNSKMLWGFIFEDDEYTNGTIYDSRNGTKYEGTIFLDNKNTLRLRGYWGFIYSTEVWTRVQ